MNDALNSPNFPTESNDIRICARRARGGIYFIISLIFLAASIYCLFVPLTDIFPDQQDRYIRIGYFAIGCIGTAFFGYNTTFNLLRLLNPQTAVILTDEALIDCTIPDGGIAFVTWDNITDIKLFGKNKCDWLGINLKSTSKVFTGLSRRSRRDLLDGIDSGMPAVILKSNDVGIDLYELRSMINERIRMFQESDRTRIYSGAPDAGSVDEEVTAMQTASYNIKAETEVTETAESENTHSETTKESTPELIPEVRTDAQPDNDDGSVHDVSAHNEKSMSNHFTVPKGPADAQRNASEEDRAPMRTQQPSVHAAGSAGVKRPTTRAEFKREQLDNIDDILAALSVSYRTKPASKENGAENEKKEN